MVIVCFIADTGNKGEISLGLVEEQHIFDLTISPIHGEHNRAQGHLFLFHDIPERK